MNYQILIPKLKIVNKEGQAVPFDLNAQQGRFICEMSGKDVILKARQIGFSSLILAMFTWDFLLAENSRSVCISHDGPSAQKLLDRVKYYISSLKDQGVEIDLKYNNRNELVNKEKNSSFYIGAAGSKTFGRGDTINNLHLSEFSFYPDMELLLSSVLQAVVPTGKVFVETTANGMNYFKTFWDAAKANQNTFKAHFYDNTFYDPDFLELKKKELGDKFPQEYPETDVEAFLSSGNTFFDKTAMRDYMLKVKDPINIYGGYYDLPV